MTTEKTTVITEETNTVLVEAQGREVSLSSALHIGRQFASAAIYGSSEPAQRNITWLTGNNEAWAANGKMALPAARGWFLDQPDEEAGLFPDDYALMDAMELLCEQGKAAPCYVSHRDTNTGKYHKVLSWSLPVASLFIICQGVPSKPQMLADPAERWGVAFAGWRDGVKSVLSMQFFIKELLDAGYNGGFYTNFSAYLTDKALGTLKAHEYVLRFADSLRADAGEDAPAAYYAYALPVVCSATTTTAGGKEKAKKGETTEIYYPVPRIPRLSRRNLDESAAYLESVAITYDQALLLESDGRVEKTIEWSIVKSKRLIAGDTSGDDTPDTYEGVDMDGNPITMKTPF